MARCVGRTEGVTRTLDYGYLADWGDRLEILDQLRQALTEAGI